jgi:CHAT domain-containing protein/tetratricopeptide (TPR) repeat protein
MLRRVVVISAVAVACATPRDPPASDTTRIVVAGVAGGASNTSLDAAIVRAESLSLRAAFDSARTALERILVTARATQDSVNEARALTLLGTTAWRRGDYAESRALGEQALKLKVRLGRGIELARSYNALGLLAWDEGRLGDASELLQRAKDAAITEGDSATSAKAANNLGLVYSEQGKLAEARRGFEDARVIAAARADARIEAGALTNLSMLDVQLGDPRSAVTRLARALTLYRSISYATGEQNALAQLATAYEALGEPRLAFAAADTALELSRKHGLRHEEAANTELAASLYRQAGDARRALALYERGRALHKEMGAAVDEGRSLRDAAEVEAGVGRRDLAKEFTLEALTLHERAGAKLEALRDHLTLADLASLAGTWPEVTTHIDAAAAVAKSLGVRPGRVEVALMRATTADRAGDGRAVLRALTSVRSDLERGGYGTEWREAALRARAFATLGQLDSAVSAGRAAVVAVERLRARFGSSFFRTTYAADKAETYASLVESLLRLSKVNEAFETADAARSRALIENLGAVRTDSVLPDAVRVLAEGDALLRRIDFLAAKMDTLEGIPSAERDDATTENIATVATALTDARSAYEALLVRTGERDATATALLESSGARVADVQRALRPGEVLVEYLVTPSHLMTFVVSADRVGQVTTEVSRDQLVRQARIARDVVGRLGPTGGGADGILASLHDVLVAPAERAGLLHDARRLVVVPHAFMAYLPFAALRRSAGGRYLVEDYSILQAPSAAVFVAMRRSGRTLSPESLGRRSIGFAPFPDALPASRRELRAFQGIVSGATGESGDRATEPRIRTALAAGGVVHLATHGRMNARNPMFSRIELARGAGSSATDDGRLEVHEILGLRVGAHLVFLSGCETGVGPAWSTEFDRGEDYASLAQAFLFAGARSVVATLWPIADEGAAEFATRFYTHLAKESPPEALAAAQREMLAGGNRSAPYYWAAYQVSGDGESAGFRTAGAGGP